MKVNTERVEEVLSDCKRTVSITNIEITRLNKELSDAENAKREAEGILLMMQGFIIDEEQEPLKPETQLQLAPSELEKKGRGKQTEGTEKLIAYLMTRMLIKFFRDKEVGEVFETDDILKAINSNHKIVTKHQVENGLSSFFRAGILVKPRIKCFSISLLWCGDRLDYDNCVAVQREWLKRAKELRELKEVTDEELYKDKRELDVDVRQT